MLEKIKVAFLSSVNQIFMFTGTAENPTETFNITANVEDAIIGMYLTKPGILRAPDGSEFLLELTLLPASLAAKQKLLNEAQAKVNELNRIVGPEPEPGTPEWNEAKWALALAPSDKAHFERIAEARQRGQRVSYRSLPFELKVVFGPKPPRPKKKPIEFAAPAPEQYDAPKNGHYFADEVAQQQAVPERVPVVIVYLTGAGDDCRVIERTTWDGWIAASTSKEPDWREKGIRCFCYVYDILYEEVKEVDFDQIYTRDEINDL